MERTQIKQLIRDELPIIMQEDVGIEEFVLRLSRRHFADKEETESKFDRVLNELRHDREENTRKWEENQRRWEENQIQLDQKFETLVDRFDLICQKLQTSIELEEDNDIKAVSTFLNYFSIVIRDTHVQYALKIKAK